MIVFLTTYSDDVQILVLILNSDVLDVVVPTSDRFTHLVKAMSTFDREHTVVPVRVVEHAVAPKFNLNVVLVIVRLIDPGVTPVEGFGDGKTFYRPQKHIRS